jgi:hypothetical protein
MKDYRIFRYEMTADVIERNWPSEGLFGPAKL